MSRIISFILFIFLSVQLYAQSPEFQAEIEEGSNPWTHLRFNNDPDNFQFAIVSDRTGGHREGVFGKAVDRLNWLMPEFVMSVGDLIEGYSEDSAEVAAQWAEFDSILAPLEMPFFFVPGNHDISIMDDISHREMYDQWMARYGKTYYHFIYKDVLFIAMNTNDGEGEMFGEDQIAYALQALEDHPEVRWTFLFMHHPIWRYGELTGFDRIEAALEGRTHTVIAGHTHHYLYEERNDQNYYVLGTTGGGSQLRGPKFGEYDHITWVTMTDNGPKLINLALNGMIDHDITDVASMELARALINNMEVDYQFLANGDMVDVSLNNGSLATDRSIEVTKLDEGGAMMVTVGEQVDDWKGKALFRINNAAQEAMFFKGRFFHHHQLNPSMSEFELEIAGGSYQEFEIEVEMTANMAYEKEIAPLELDWVAGFETAPLTPEFQLSGTYSMDIDASPKGITSTDVPIFLENHEVMLETPFDGAEIRYTLDGSEPNEDAPVYSDPINLTNTTELKAKLYGKEGLASETFAYTYTKVSPRPADKVKKSKEGLRYEYFEDNFLVLPDFDTLTAIKSGVISEFTPALIGERKDHYAILYTGYIEVPTTGLYTFYTYSDDGSKLFIGDELVVDNDGSHSARLRKGMVALEAGKHSLRLEYFEDFLGQELRVGYAGPSLEEQEIPFELYSH